MIISNLRIGTSNCVTAAEFNNIRGNKNLKTEKTEKKQSPSVLDQPISNACQYHLRR